MKKCFFKEYGLTAFLAAFFSFLLFAMGCKGGSPQPSDAPVSSAPSDDDITVITFSTATPAPVSEIHIPTDTASPFPTPEPDALTVSDDVYTIAWITDTQHYTRQDNGVFAAMTDFLRINQSRMNLCYILFTGDFVHNPDLEEQWKDADSAMRLIDGIPNGVLAGNHDVTVNKKTDYSYFSEYFGENRYRGSEWYGDSYENNRCHYDLIDAGHTSYLFVYIGFDVTDAEILWAKDVFSMYPERIGVLCAHSYFNTDLTLTEEGLLLHEHLVEKVPNLYLLFCGHRYNSCCIEEKLDDDGDGIPDRTVLQMMANYQAIGDASAESRTGGDGYIRFLQIDESEKTIRYYSYSPYLDDYTYFDDLKHQQEKYAFSPQSESGAVAIPWLN